MEVDSFIKDAEGNIKEYIDMLYIQAISKLSPERKKETSKKLDNKLLEDYFKKRGYISNLILGRPVMVKGFVCAFIGNDYVEVWHDKASNQSVFVNNSLITGLPITLNYMERI